MGDEIKPCLLCASKIKEIKSDEKHPIILVKLSKPASHDTMRQIVRNLKGVFPDQFRFLIIEPNIDMKIADEVSLAKIGLRRMEE